MLTDLRAAADVAWLDKVFHDRGVGTVVIVIREARAEIVATERMLEFAVTEIIVITIGLVMPASNEPIAAVIAPVISDTTPAMSSADR